MIVYNLENKCFVNIKEIFSRCHILSSKMAFVSGGKNCSQYFINFFFLEGKCFKNKMHNFYTFCIAFSKSRFIAIDIDIFSAFLEQYREKPRSCRINYRTARKPHFGVPIPIHERSRIELEKATWHITRHYQARQYSGATSKMQPPENSWLARRNRISLSHRNRCVSPPRLFPRGESKRRRSLVLEGETFL